MKVRVFFLAILWLLISSCGGVQESVSPTSALTSTPLPQPSETPKATSTAGPLYFEDSGQRLGAGRSWDLSLGDFDGDDDLDAIVANGVVGEVGSAVWLNGGRANFIKMEQDLGYGMGLDVGDLDGDGDLDAIIVGWYEAGRVLLNNGSAEFTDTGQSIGPAGGWDLALGDIDGDGDFDALVAHEDEDTIWLNDGTGFFTDSGQSLGTTYTASAELGDLDNDGDLDAVTVGWGEPGKVWFNNGSGIFSDSDQTLTPGSIHIHGMILGDLTGNGALDVIMAGSPNQVWFNDGAGAFTDSQQSLSNLPGDTAALGDLDEDGDLDVYLAVGTMGRAEDEIWLNDGHGQFFHSGFSLSQGFSSGIGLGDFDYDGDLDAFVTHGELGKSYDGGLPNEVWLNKMR